MRLDQASDDFQVRIDKASVEFDTRALGCGAEIDVVGIITREVVLDAEVFEHPLVANQLGQFVALIRAMQTGSDQNTDRLARHTGGEQLAQDHR